MSNENSDKKKPGLGGTFKVRLKKPVQHDIYLKSDDNGNLTWDAAGKSFTGTTTDPSTWTFKSAGGTSKYLKKVAQPGADDKVEWSGESSDSNWKFSSNQLYYDGAQPKYLKHNGDNKSPTLASISTTEIVIEIPNP